MQCQFKFSYILIQATNKKSTNNFFSYFSVVIKFSMTAILVALGEAMEEVLWQSSYTSCSTTRCSNARKRFHFATDYCPWKV
jgi:hypothetical protein